MSEPTGSWQSLVTTALLGTDRRSPPEPPPGPIGDVVADVALAGSGAAADVRLLDHVAVTTLARRAATKPEPPAEPLLPPPADHRTLCPTEAVESWHHVVVDWPVLEDEWLSLAWRHDVVLPGDLLIDLLERHRHDPARTAVVVAIGSDIVGWLHDHVPSLGAPRPGPADGDPLALPALPIGAPLEPLLDADGATFAGTLLADLRCGRLTAIHRPVLINLLARCRTIVLDDTIDALTSLADSDALAATLVAVARCRRDMLASFAGAEDRGPT